MNKEKEVEASLKNALPEEEKLKYEIAQELGVLDKVLEGGQVIINDDAKASADILEQIILEKRQGLQI